MAVALSNQLPSKACYIVRLEGYTISISRVIISRRLQGDQRKENGSCITTRAGEKASLRLYWSCTLKPVVNLSIVSKGTLFMLCWPDQMQYRAYSDGTTLSELIMYINYGLLYKSIYCSVKNANRSLYLLSNVMFTSVPVIIHPHTTLQSSFDLFGGCVVFQVLKPRRCHIYNHIAWDSIGLAWPTRLDSGES